MVVLGAGIHSVKRDLTPTRNGLAYAGNAMRCEIVNERGRTQVQADLVLACVIVARVFGALTVSVRILWVQARRGAVALALVLAVP